jgi:hypothetical protein
MINRGKPADPEPPPVTNPLEKAAQRRAALAARQRDVAPVTSPPATSSKARPERRAIAAVPRPEPKVVAVVRWKLDDLPGQQEFETTYYENGRFNDPDGNLTWSLSKGVLRGNFSPGNYSMCWFGADGKSVRGANSFGPTFSGQVIKGSFGDTTSQPITAVDHVKREDPSGGQSVHIYFANGRIDDPDGPATWSLVSGRLKLVYPGMGPSGSANVTNARVAPDGKSWRGTNNMNKSFSGRLVDGSLLGVTR